MGRYADRDQLLADLLPEVVSVAQKDAVGRVLDGVSAFIDKYCLRTEGYFDVSPVMATMRRVRGENERYLRLPDHISGTVTVAGIDDASWYEADQNGWLYFKQPNFIDPSIDEFADATGSNIWYVGRLYEVTARWGFAEIPKPIVEACRQLTLKAWETQRGTLNDVTPSGYVVERAMPLFVRDTLNLFRKREFER